LASFDLYHHSAEETLLKVMGTMMLWTPVRILGAAACHLNASGQKPDRLNFCRIDDNFPKRYVACDTSLSAFRHKQTRHRPLIHRFQDKISLAKTHRQCKSAIIVLWYVIC